jgi:putative sigma-54 modulation protein
MELQITGTNIEISPATRQYIERKLNKLNKHLPDIIDIKVEVSDEKTKSPLARYLVRATVNSGIGGAVFHGEDRAEDLFKAVDRVVVVVTRQMERRKGKLYDRGRGNPLARGKSLEAEIPNETVKKVVKTKRFVIEPMSLQEAIDSMERLGHNFFLFVDSNEEELCLLYRRNDGNYGLIVPEVK